MTWTQIKHQKGRDSKVWELARVRLSRGAFTAWWEGVLEVLLQNSLKIYSSNGVILGIFKQNFWGHLGKIFGNFVSALAEANWGTLPCINGGGGVWGSSPRKFWKFTLQMVHFGAFWTRPVAIMVRFGALLYPGRGKLGHFAIFIDLLRCWQLRPSHAITQPDVVKKRWSAHCLIVGWPTSKRGLNKKV